MSFVRHKHLFLKGYTRSQIAGSYSIFCMLSFSKYRQFFKVVIPFTLINNVLEFQLLIYSPKLSIICTLVGDGGFKNSKITRKKIIFLNYQKVNTVVISTEEGSLIGVGQRRSLEC